MNRFVPCGTCKHRYGLHTWGVTGPCAVKGCTCPHFDPERPADGDSDSEGAFW